MSCTALLCRTAVEAAVVVALVMAQWQRSCTSSTIAAVCKRDAVTHPNRAVMRAAYCKSMLNLPWK
jgi:hypothetical protein